MQAGRAEVVHEGETYTVDRPEIIPTADAAAAFSSTDRLYQRIFATNECMRLRIAPGALA